MVKRITGTYTETGVKKVVVNYLDENSESQQKAFNYDSLTADQKAVVDSYETLSNELMNA